MTVNSFVFMRVNLLRTCRVFSFMDYTIFYEMEKTHLRRYKLKGKESKMDAS